MNKVSGILIGAIALASVQFSAQAAVGERVTLAYQGPLSGAEKTIGQSQLKSMKFAIKLFAEQNPAAPIINLVEIDDHGDPAVAQELAPKTAAQTEIIGVVGSAYSAASQVSIPVWSRASLTAISPSATRASLTNLLPAGTSSFFRVASPDLDSAKSLLEAAIFKVDSPKIFIISDQTSYSEDFRNNLESIAKNQGLTITGTASLAEREVPSSSFASKVMSMGANVVISTGYYPHTFEVVRSLRSNLFTGVIAATPATYDPTRLKRAEYMATEGLRVLASEVNLQELSAPLAKRYSDVTGQEPDIYTPATINATSVFLKCISDGARSRVEVYDCVKIFKGYAIDGMPLSFTNNGNSARTSFPVYEVKQGNLLLMRDLYPVLYNNVLSAKILKGITISKGSFNLNLLKTGSVVRIPIGSEPLSISTSLASASYTVDARVRDSEGSLTRLAYPIRIETLNPGIHHLEFTIRDNVTETSEAHQLILAQNFTLAVPNFQVSELTNDSFKINFSQSVQATSYDLRISVNGSAQSTISNISSGEKISGFKPGASITLTLVAKTESEFAVSPEVTSAPISIKIPFVTLTCTKGKATKQVTGANPKCPKGYAVKKRS